MFTTWVIIVLMAVGRDFEPGMVLTIEPGIYIPRNASTAHLPEKYRGIGVRIEDDVPDHCRWRLKCSARRCPRMLMQLKH